MIRSPLWVGSLERGIPSLGTTLVYPGLNEKKKKKVQRIRNSNLNVWAYQAQQMPIVSIFTTTCTINDYSLHNIIDWDVNFPLIQCDNFNDAASQGFPQRNVSSVNQVGSFPPETWMWLVFDNEDYVSWKRWKASWWIHGAHIVRLRWWASCSPGMLLGPWSPSFGNVILVPAFHPFFTVMVRILSRILDVCPSSFITFEESHTLTHCSFMSAFKLIYGPVMAHPSGYFHFLGASMENFFKGQSQFPLNGRIFLLSPSSL